MCYVSKLFHLCYVSVHHFRFDNQWFATHLSMSVVQLWNLLELCLRSTICIWTEAHHISVFVIVMIRCKHYAFAASEPAQVE